MANSLNDIEIVELCKKQNRAGERLLFKKYYSSMLYLCTRYVKDEFAAKEVLSDGFIKVFNNLSSFEFRNGQGLKSWIKKIMINESLMHLRKNNGLHENLSLDHISDVSFSCPSDSIDEELIYQAIRRLPSGYRTVLNLFIVEGFSHKEIADKLGITENTSRSQLAHARKKLQQSLNGML